MLAVAKCKEVRFIERVEAAAEPVLRAFCLHCKVLYQAPSPNTHLRTEQQHSKLGSTQSVYRAQEAPRRTWSKSVHLFRRCVRVC